MSRCKPMSKLTLNIINETVTTTPVSSQIDNEFTYLIRDGDTNRYKIGKSQGEPTTKLKELQTGNHGIFTLIADTQLISTDSLSNRFSHNRLHGKWFIFTEEEIQHEVLPLFTGNNFNLWQWTLSQNYITTIKQIVITSLDPLNGQINFGTYWLPFNEYETLKGWIIENISNTIKYDETLFLSKQPHPISLLAKRLIREGEETYKDSINRTIEIYELEDINGLNKCLADVNHKYHNCIKESIERDKIQELTPTYYFLNHDDNETIVNHIIRDIVSSCYNPRLIQQNIPIISVIESKQVYGIFPSGIKPIKSSDNVICNLGNGGISVYRDKIRNINTDKVRFNFVIENWIDDDKQRELLRSLAKNILLRLPWKNPLILLSSSCDIYRPFETIRNVFNKLSGGKNIHYIYTKRDRVPHVHGNMYIYLGIQIPDKYRNIGYNIYLSDQTQISSNDKFLIEYFGDNSIKQEDFFERDHEYFLSFILWALGDNFHCQWNTII